MNRITSLDSYKGTWLERLYKKDPVESIRLSLKDKFEKGVIDSVLYETACNQLESISKGDYLEKAGEGSRGGHVIGHTSSGKPIYESGKHSDYHNFHEYDHSEASDVHRGLARKYEAKAFHAHGLVMNEAGGEGNKEYLTKYSKMRKEAEDKQKHHEAHAEYHLQESRPKQYRERSIEIARKVKEIKKS